MPQPRRREATLDQSPDHTKPAPDRRAKKPAKKPSAEQFRFGFLVHDVSRVRRTLMDQTMRPLGITRSQWSVLSALSRSGNDGMMQVDLARLMDVGKVTVGGLVDRLEASGHIERRPDAGDRRAKRVFITDQGFEVIRLMAITAAKMNERILQGVSPEHQQITEDVLFHIKGNMKNILRETELLGGATGKYGSGLPDRDNAEQL